MPNKEKATKAIDGDGFPSEADLTEGAEASKLAELGNLEPADIKVENAQNEKEAEESTQTEDSVAPAEHNYAVEARDSGWAPKEEYKGDPKLWVDAKEWISRAPLLHRITQQSKELKNIRKTNEAMSEMMRNMVEKTDKQRTDEILAQRKESIEQGDVNAFEKYDKEYNEVIKTSQEMAQKFPAPSDLPQEVADFVDRNNKWYNTNPENIALKVYADQVEGGLATTRPELTLEQRLTATENIVKDDPRYRTMFSNPNRERAPAVESKTTPVPRSKNTITFAELPSDAKRVLRDQKVKDPGLNLDKLAQDLLDSGAVKYE